MCSAGRAGVRTSRTSVHREEVVVVEAAVAGVAGAGVEAVAVAAGEEVALVEATVSISVQGEARSTRSCRRSTSCTRSRRTNAGCSSAEYSSRSRHRRRRCRQMRRGVRRRC